MSARVDLRRRPAGGPDVIDGRDAARRSPAVDPVILALYGLLAVAACGRSSFQLLTESGEAPLASVLSAVAAGLYGAAGIALRHAGHAARVLCATELAGVLLVGTLTLTEPHLFPQATVWSAYGVGYGFAPLLLPAAALWSLRGRRRLAG